jgi:four helix bundle protein
MRDYAKYEVWVDSMNLVTDIYKITKRFPEDEKSGITNQMRRCAVPVPSNIAEGAGRSSEKDFKRFLEIAMASSFGLKTQVLICRNLDYIDSEMAKNMELIIDKVSKQLNGFIKKLKANINSLI